MIDCQDTTLVLNSLHLLPAVESCLLHGDQGSVYRGFSNVCFKGSTSPTSGGVSIIKSCFSIIWVNSYRFWGEGGDVS
jgi:hypothetical protein